jgi:hypothetical protein
MLDVFMLTFGEPEADENFEILKLKAPHAKRYKHIRPQQKNHAQVIFMYVMLMQ